MVNVAISEFECLKLLRCLQKLQAFYCFPCVLVVMKGSTACSFNAVVSYALTLLCIVGLWY
jgi:hypothetical protein